MRRLFVGITVLWAGLAFVGDGLTSVVVPVLVDRVAAPEIAGTVVGLVTFAGLAAGALWQPYAGAKSDRLLPRYGRRGPLAVGVCLTVLALVGLAVLGSSTLLGLLLAFLVVSVAAALAQAALQAWIPDLVSADRRGRASGWKGFADVGGAAVAFVLLGQTVMVSTGLAIGVVALAVAASGFLALVLVRERTGVGASPGRNPAPIYSATGRRRGGGLNVMRVKGRHAGPFVHLVAARFLFLVGVFSIGRFLVLAVADRFGLRVEDAAEQTSVVLGVLAFVSMLAAPPAGWIADRAGRRPLMIAGALAAAVGAVGLAGAPSLLLLTAVGVIVALGNAAFTTANWAMLTDTVPAGEAARYMGLANLGTAGAAAAAGLLGPVADLGNRAATGWGYTMVLLAAAGLMLASAATVTRMPSATLITVPVPSDAAVLDGGTHDDRN